MAKEEVPALVQALLRHGLREVGEQITGHPVGLALAALVLARAQSQKRGESADDWAAILERTAAIIRTERTKP